MTTEEKEEMGIAWLYRLDSGNTHGWQFRIAEGTKDAHSKLFSDSGRHTDAALVDACKYRDTYLAAHPELLASSAPVWLRLPKHNRSGILGVNYSETTLPSGTRYTSWQMTCPRPEGGTPRTARYSVAKFGETQALMMAVEARRDATRDLLLATESKQVARAIQQLIGDYDDIVSELRKSVSSGNDSELLTIIREARLDATSKQAEIRVRLGQHRFRRLVMAHWSGRCAVTGASILLAASHIKPWRDSSDFDRINPYNGLALSALYDHAFDAGYITFTEDGRLLAAPAYQSELERVGISLSARISAITADHHPYLRHHRDVVFRGRPTPEACAVAPNQPIAVTTHP